MINNTKNLIEFLFDNYIKNAEIALDMTCGNGNDSKLILEKLNPASVYAFDIQEIAIKNTKELCQGFDKLKLIHDSHENFEKYIDDKIDLAVFNLGYLPGADKSIVTKGQTVLDTIKKLLIRINLKGKIILTFYPGHPSGREEKELIIKYLESLNQKNFSILKFDFINQINNPPFVIMLTKIND